MAEEVMQVSEEALRKRKAENDEDGLPDAKRAKPEALKRAAEIDQSEPPDAKKEKQEETAQEVVVKRRKVVGQVFVAGMGEVGQLGLGPDVFEKARFALVPNLDDVVDVVAGGVHTLCLTADGKVWSFGCNDEGALGRTTTVEGSETTPGRVEFPEPIAQLTAGDCHSVALSVSGTVYIWGCFRDSGGQMGLVSEGKAEHEPVKVATGVVQIASGSEHVAMLTAEGDLLTMGCPKQGQLGRVSAKMAAEGDCRANSRLYLTPTKVPVVEPEGGKSVAFDSVWAGGYTTIARQRDTGLLYGFGLNNFRQLGSFEGSSNKAELCLYSPEPMSSCSGHRWKLVSAGEHHTLLLREDGTVFTLGRKEYGRLGLGVSTPADGKDQETPAQVLKLSDCVDVSCGEIVSYAIDSKGHLFSWGCGGNYQLGHKGEEDKYEPEQVAGRLAERKVLAVSGGGQHAVVLAAPAV
ncbi:regulator of chromosome condensation-like isoform X1 [Haemaphysalis longicornis]